MTLPVYDSEITWRHIKLFWQDRGTARIFVSDGKKVGHVTYVSVHELGDSTHQERGGPINKFEGEDGIVIHVSWYQDGYGPKIGEDQGA